MYVSIQIFAYFEFIHEYRIQMHACAARSWRPVCFACKLRVSLYVFFFILRSFHSSFRFLLNHSRRRRFRGRHRRSSYAHIVGIRWFVYCVEPFFLSFALRIPFSFSTIQRCPSINAKRVCWCWIALVCEFQCVLSFLSSSLLFFHLSVLCCVI